jgi:hypothetical protein
MSEPGSVSPVGTGFTKTGSDKKGFSPACLSNKEYIPHAIDH